MMKFIQLAAFVLATFSMPAFAHYLWIEASPDGHSAKIFFGEYQEDVREVSGGRLDEMALRDTSVLTENGSRQSVSTEIAKDHFLIASEAPVRGFITQKLDYEVKDWRKSGIGVVKPMFYARAWVPGANLPQPELKLDIVPVDKECRAVRISFDSKPLINAKVNLHAPNLWSREFVTGEDGVLRLETPWPGSYVVEVIHLEKTSGTFKGMAYEAVRHRATLTVQGR